MTSPVLFVYPSTTHHRRHEPFGYESYPSYKPWLRDEFTFRCVYCLTREAWARGLTTFNLYHFLPVAHNPDLAVDYGNLLYAQGNSLFHTRPVKEVQFQRLTSILSSK